MDQLYRKPLTSQVLNCLEYRDRIWLKLRLDGMPVEHQLLLETALEKYTQAIKNEAQNAEVESPNR